MPDFPYHRSLRLQNFTVFKDASFEFVPGINAFIGKNGTGKTHLLKTLYSYQCINSAYQPNANFDKIDTFENVFQVSELSDLRRFSAPEPFWSVSGKWGNDTEPWHFEVSGKAGGWRIKSSMPIPVFIPATDMIGHSRRFVSTYDRFQIDFDQTYRDIVAALLSPESREKPTDSEAYQTLSRTLGGEVEEESERFYLRTPQGRFPMPLVAEGLRKIATLQQLLKNGFLRPGDTLFWDEPEVNLNPKLMGNVVAVLLALARSGVQIFLATHSYVILKELDLQATKEDSVRFFALEKNDEEGTLVHQAEDFDSLTPNAILDQFSSIYDRELTKATGRTRKK